MLQSEPSKKNHLLKLLVKRAHTTKYLLSYVYLVMDIFLLDSYVVILFSDKWISWGE